MSPIHVLTSCLRALLDWAPAFAFTQLIEVPIYRRTLRCPAEVAFAASAITHPIVWFLFPWMGCHMLGVRGVPVVVASELFAWIAEAVYLAFATGRPAPAFVFALVANAASFGAGLLAQATARF